MKVWVKYALAVTFIWAGMVLGISFLEAPLKFQAPNITLALGLGIGRLVFAALNKFEILFMLVIAIAAWRAKFVLSAKLIVSILAFILVIQTFYLLPLLDTRAQLIIDGNTPPASPHHWTYIILEVCKLALLVWLGVKLLGFLEKR